MMVVTSPLLKKSEHNKFRRAITKYWMHYLMILPAIVLLLIFSYTPMFGLLIAFQDYSIRSGISGFFTSEWVGLEHFWFLRDQHFWQVVRNTLNITILRMLITWPLPIILAIMLNEVRGLRYKRSIQSFIYLPHFISWIVAAYMITQFLALDGGIVNNVIRRFGGNQIHFLGNPGYFRWIIAISAAWKTAGWGTIIYLAALSNVDVTLQDAAVIDGAGRFKRIWHIDLPCIKPTIVILLILTMPALLSAGFEQIFPLQNPANMAASEVLDVYLVRLGLSQGRYSLSTAIGLVLSIINLTIVLVSNKIARLLGNDGFF